MEKSHFVLTSTIGKSGCYNKFKDQNSLLNQSSGKILLIGDSIISKLGRCPENKKKYFSSHSTLNLIQHVLWRIQNLNFSNNSSIKYIFILSGTNNLDNNDQEKVINGIIISLVSAQKKCHNTTVVLIPLHPRSKKKLDYKRKH